MNSVVTWSPESEHIGDCVLTIGVFDGVHLGHINLISETVRRAALAGVPSVIVTFDRDPDSVVDPGADIVQLLSITEKIERLSLTGVDRIVVLTFNTEMAAISPSDFLHCVVLRSMNPLQIVVGEDFRFGNRAAGDIRLLKELSLESGIDVVGIQLLELDGAPVKSTRIKHLLVAGEVEAAGHLLGRPHLLSGTVIHGTGRGTKVLSIPTVNIRPRNGSVLPAAGVYSGKAQLGDKEHPAAIFIGRSPSFSDSVFGVEAHLLDFAQEVYGTTITLTFDTRLRDLEEFAVPEALASAMQADVDLVRRLSGSEPEKS